MIMIFNNSDLTYKNMFFFSLVLTFKCCVPEQQCFLFSASEFPYSACGPVPNAFLFQLIFAYFFSFLRTVGPRSIFCECNSNLGNLIGCLILEFFFGNDGQTYPEDAHLWWWLIRISIIGQQQQPWGKETTDFF